MIDFKGAGTQYHRVMANGQLWSKHTTRYKADESAYDLGVEALRQMQEGTLTEFPTIFIESSGRVNVVPDPDNTPAMIPAPSSPPTSDDGMDVVDFFDIIDPFDPATAVVLQTTPLTPLQAVIAGAMIAAAAHSKEKPWPHSMMPSATFITLDGKSIRIGATWRGYKLGVDQRDKTAIRIGDPR